MTVKPCFVQGGEMAKASLSPKLARAFESSLCLVALGFDRSTADRPASFAERLVIHALRLVPKVILFFPEDLLMCNEPPAAASFSVQGTLLLRL